MPVSTIRRSLSLLARGFVYGSVSLLAIAIVAVTISYAQSGVEPVAADTVATELSTPLPTPVPLPSMTPFPSPIPLVAPTRPDLMDTATTYYGPWIEPAVADASYPSHAAWHHATTTSSAEGMLARPATAAGGGSASRERQETSGGTGGSGTAPQEASSPIVNPVVPLPAPTVPGVPSPTTPAEPILPGPTPAPSLPAVPLPLPSPTLPPLLP